MKKLLLFFLLASPSLAVAQVSLIGDFAVTATIIDMPFCETPLAGKLFSETWNISQAHVGDEVNIIGKQAGVLQRIRKGKSWVFEGSDDSGNAWNVKITPSPGGFTGSATTVPEKTCVGDKTFCVVRLNLVGARK